jgi:hypothetical protein
MHCDDKFGDPEGSALFSVREVPDAAQNLVGELGLFEYLFSILTLAQSVTAAVGTLGSKLPERMPF